MHSEHAYDVQIREITTSGELEQAYPLMKVLRTELNFQDYISIYDAAKRADRYTLVGAYANDRCLGLMGFRILWDYVHGKHLYIDDLVTNEQHRSKGIGSKLLKFAEHEARRQSCTGLRLCTGNANDSGKRFYEREGWQFRAVVFKKKLSDNR